MPDISIVNGALIDQSPSNGRTHAAVPLGPLLIVSALEEAGFDVDFVDYQLYPVKRKPSVDTFYRFLCTLRSEIIGISLISANLPTTLGAIRRFKEEFPHKTIILGGPCATDTPTEIMMGFPADIIVRGEGERTVVELMRALENNGDLSDVLGITYRAPDGVIHSNPSRPRVTRLDTSPNPAYHHIDWSAYGHMIPIMSARGCPYDCTFCSVHSIWERRVTQRSIEGIIREITAVKDEIHEICFVDDTFVLDKRRVYGIIEAMKAEGIHLPWRCNGRVNTAEKKLLKAMADSGCHMMLFGLESGSDKVLKRIRKRFTAKQALEMLELASRYIPRLDVSFIWGFPFETMEDFYLTLEALGEVSRLPNRTLIHGHLLCAFPKSSIYQEYKHLIRFSRDFYPAQRAFLPTDRLSKYPELIEIVEGFPDICAAFYYFDHPELEQKSEMVNKIWPPEYLDQEGR